MPQRVQSGQPVHMRFDDTSLLPMLFGLHNRHIARIEQGFAVLINSRGNELLITGPPSAAAAAEAVFTALYDRLKRGLAVESAEVDAAIRMTTARGEASDGAAGEAVAAKASPFDPVTVIQTRLRQIEPRSLRQTEYIRALHDYELVFSLGPAGTGKTYLAVAVAVSMFLSGKVERIILSRPAVEAGERLGFLPGDLKEKVDPYLRPLYDALYDMMPADAVAKRLESGEIEIAPLAFMRGRTLSKAFVILDEGQNTTPVQMKMFLTRLGERARMVVTGDQSQVDLPPGTRSGLAEAIATLKGMEGAAFVRFTDADVVRNPLVARIVRAYEGRERQARSGPGRKRPEDTES